VQAIALSRPGGATLAGSGGRRRNPAPGKAKPAEGLAGPERVICVLPMRGTA
jgi:hypothetical protein